MIRTLVPRCLPLLTFLDIFLTDAVRCRCAVLPFRVIQSANKAKEDSKADDWVNHQVLLSVGQVPEQVKGDIRASISFGKPNEGMVSSMNVVAGVLLTS